jgi:YHS domain-containing protein
VEIALEGLPPDARIVERVGDELVIAAASAATAVEVATARAAAGQILCTEAVVLAAPGVTYRPLGRVRLRNVVKPMALYEIGGAPVESRVFVAPVCRMQVNADSAARALSVGDARRYFCSTTCAVPYELRDRTGSPPLTEASQTARPTRRRGRPP